MGGAVADPGADAGIQWPVLPVLPLRLAVSHLLFLPRLVESLLQSRFEMAQKRCFCS